MRMDLHYFLLFLLCQSALLSPLCGDVRSGTMSKHASVRFEEEWATFDSADPESDFFNRMASEQAPEYFGIQETFIHITSVRRMERQGSYSADGESRTSSSCSSSSTDGARCFEPMYKLQDADASDDPEEWEIGEDDVEEVLSVSQHHSMNSLFANAFSILSRCATSGK